MKYTNSFPFEYLNSSDLDGEDMVLTIGTRPCFIGALFSQGIWKFVLTLFGGISKHIRSAV